MLENRREVLNRAIKLHSNSGLPTIKIGCELEFFLLQKNHEPIRDQEFLQKLIAELKENLTSKFSLVYQLEKEQGVSQIELKTNFTSDLKKLCEEIESAKTLISHFAKEKNLIESFAAQPFQNDCGNALQFNISLHQNEQNIFDFDKEILNKIAFKLLSKTNEMLIILAPNKDDYFRFSPETNLNLFKKGKFTAPINLSFGFDNRTCAIRIPKSQNSTRLEYRIASANANPFLAIAAILLTIIDDIDCSQKGDFKQIHGNAFDEQYNLKKLCSSFEQATELFLKKDNMFKNFFTKK
jgi:glutamine synthetase